MGPYKREIIGWPTNKRRTVTLQFLPCGKGNIVTNFPGLLCFCSSPLQLKSHPFFFYLRPLPLVIAPPSLTENHFQPSLIILPFCRNPSTCLRLSIFIVSRIFSFHPFLPILLCASMRNHFFLFWCLLFFQASWLSYQWVTFLGWLFLWVLG